MNEATRKTIYDFLVKEQEHLGNNIIYEEMPFDVPWVELEKRNLTRGNKAVPKPVLRDMYLRMQKYLGKHRQYVPNPELPKAVIFDLDGTLANNDHRDAFAYWKLDKDTPVEFVVNILKMYKQNGYKILCVSGRNSGTKDDNLKYYNMTADWLSYNAIHGTTCICELTMIDAKTILLRKKSSGHILRTTIMLNALLMIVIVSLNFGVELV